MTATLPFQSRPRLVWPTLLLIVAIVTLLNAIKPLTVDDAAYAEYAKQIAAHPTDPYGFQVFWSQWPEPANWLLAPPALLYWWAIAIRFFGPSVFVWKLWLLPWIAAFVFGVHALLRRFSPSVALPMTVFTAFAPVYLPAINYMLDVPALGLGLLALSVAMRGIDRKSIGLIALSGVMFGVALQTKYTVVTLPAIAAVYGFTRRRYLLPVIPGIIAIAVFAAWECFVSRTYGQSHFLLHLTPPDLMEGKDPWYFLIVSAVTLLGGVAGPLALVMALSLGARPAWLTGGAAVIVAAFVATAIAPIGLKVFAILGMAVWACVGITLWALVRRPGEPIVRRDDGFLLGWVAVEAAAFLAISPFTASRRLMGLVFVLTLVAGRLLEGRAASTDLTKALRRLVSFGVVLGLLFFTIDWLDARAYQHTTEAAIALVNAHRTPGEHVYYEGHWGLQFYAERAGARPIIPDHTALQPGDWVIYPHAPVNTQVARLTLADVEPVGVFTVSDPIHLEMVPAFYGRLVALDHRTGPRMSVIAYQVKKPFVPLTGFEPKFVIDWATTRELPLPPMSVRAVLRAMKSVDSDDRNLAALKILYSGPDALIAASQDVDAGARAWAIHKLAVLPRTPAVSAALAAAASDPDPAVRAAARDAMNDGRE